jgi:hypothetical protein
MGALPDVISLNYHFNEDNNMVDIMCRNPNLVTRSQVTGETNLRVSQSQVAEVETW